MDGTNVCQEEVTSATRVKLAVVVGPRTTATETGRLAFASHSHFGAQCPMVEAILPLVDWIDKNRSKWGRIMEDAEATTRFEYNESWCCSQQRGKETRERGRRACSNSSSTNWTTGDTRASSYPRPSRASSMSGRGDGPWQRPPPVPPSPASHIWYEQAEREDSQGRGGALAAPRARRREDRSKATIANPRPIHRLCLLPGENTRGICREIAFPTLRGVAFCKRWNLGYACFGDCPRAASRIHLPVSVVDEVAAAMTAERAAEPAHTAQA